MTEQTTTEPGRKTDAHMNGAQALLQTLVDAGIDTVFSNPGTSEMHFVAGLDAVPEIRPVLALFEGVATGAADGYARMAGRPAATLLHLGCGLGNGLANLHNARKGRVPMLNIVGDHARYHTQYDAQLQSDIETVARNVSDWVRTSESTEALCEDAVEAITAANGPPGQVATLILPADVSWSDGGVPAQLPAPVQPPPASTETVNEIAKVLSGKEKCAVLLGGRALREPGLMAASRIAKASGAKLYAEVFPSRMERGEGLPYVERIAYFSELASVQLAGLDHLILLDAKAPVSFFAYPGKKSYLVPDGCTVHELVSPEQCLDTSLAALVDALDAGHHEPDLQQPVRPSLPSGKLTGEKVCQAIGSMLPSNVIISDEAQTSGVMLASQTAGAPRHDVLTLTGGAIGQGLPVALGAAIACPERPVIALVGDGSAMYTIQALWSMVRENADVTVIVFNNRAYSILNIELQRVGAESGGKAAKSQLNLAGPDLDFVQLGESMGVPSQRADTCEAFNDALRTALNEPGPHLIDAIVPSAFKGIKLKALPHLLKAFNHMPTPVAKAIKKRIAP